MADNWWRRNGMRQVTRDDLPASIQENGMISVKESYGIKEMAYLFGVTWCTMQKWLHKRLIPSIRQLGTLVQEKKYIIRHRALMRWIAENPDYEFVLEKLDGDLDKFEPATLEQKQKEILRAIARSPRETGGQQNAGGNNPIPENRNPSQPETQYRKRSAPGKPRKLTPSAIKQREYNARKAARKAAREAITGDWPW